MQPDIFAGAGDGQCHQNPIVMIIAGNKRFRKVGRCCGTGGIPTWTNFWLSQPIANDPQDSVTTGSRWACVQTFWGHLRISMTHVYMIRDSYTRSSAQVLVGFTAYARQTVELHFTSNFTACVWPWSNFWSFVCETFTALLQ